MTGLYADSAFIIFIYFTLLFAMACRQHNYAIADIGWGTGFILTALFSAWMTPQHSPLEIIVTLLVLFWGSRLSVHIYLRNKNRPEDFRYREMRERWGKHANVHAYVKLYLVQAIIMWVVSLAIMIAAQTDSAPLTWQAWILAAIAGFGFLYESISDYQLAQFKKSSANRGKIMTGGLWQYSRHPNYFGEIVFWWGISLLVMISSGQCLTLISGVTMNILIVYVSGVPMLEKKYKDNPAYRDYIAKTNSILPKLTFKST